MSAVTPHYFQYFHHLCSYQCQLLPSARISPRYCSNIQVLLPGTRGVVEKPSLSFPETNHPIKLTQGALIYRRKEPADATTSKMDFEKAQQWGEIKGFPLTFVSPTGKWRRPASPILGDSEVPAGPLLVLRSGRWRGDRGDRLRSTVQLPRGCHRLLMEAGAVGTRLCQPGWDGSRGGDGSKYACFTKTESLAWP